MTLKEKQFVKITAQTLNPTQAVRETYQLGKNGGSKEKKQREQTARAIASENLTKPHIRKGLQELLEEKIDKDKRTQLISRNASQDINLPASNQALDMINKMTGAYTPQVKVNININPANIDKIIDSKLNELKQLQSQT